MSQLSITSFFKRPKSDEDENQTDCRPKKQAKLMEDSKHSDNDAANREDKGKETEKQLNNCETTNEQQQHRQQQETKSELKQLSPTKNSTPKKDSGDSKGVVKSQEPPKVLPTSPSIDMKVVIANTIARGASALHENIGKTWFRALQREFNQPYFYDLSKFVLEQRQHKTVFPPEHMVYLWTHFCDIKATRVVILGQDPYHGPNQAHGLCFSVQKGVKPPPSLENIFKELESDIKDFKRPSHGDLTGWAKQGVLLLNACLTVNRGAANSHANKGWEKFTDNVISWISKNITTSVVFLLWGSPAQKKKALVSSRHKIFTAVHPSPLSAHRGFFGCKHFSQTNQYLRKQGLPEIDWSKLD